MEILFITHKYPPSVGGMEKQSYELIQGVSKNFKVHSIIYDNKSSLIKFLLSIPFKVKKILKENPNISLIHLNDGLMAGFSLKLKKITNIPIIATIHGLDIVFPSKWFQKIIVNKMKRFDGFIAVSQATGEELLKRGFEKDKVFVVRNGVDADMSHIHKEVGFRKELEKKLNIPLKDKKILVSVGRSVRRKGFSWFLNKVMHHLDENVIYLIIGPAHRHIHKIHFLFKLLPNNLAHKISLAFGLGMDEIEIREALKNKGLNNRAFYLGKLPFKEMIQILKHSDIFIMPNIRVTGDAEGFGLVALEAAICGTPVIASAIEGITCAIIDGKNGFLSPAEEEDMWIEKITKLLSDDDTLKKFGESAKHYSITNYAWDKMIDGYISVFKIINKRYEVLVRKAETIEEDGKLLTNELPDSMVLNQYIHSNALKYKSSN